MARYIDAETFENEMYYESFEKSSDMQKWDSGCWIRYKLFADCLEKQPTADVVEVVRCKDCIYRWFNGVNLHTCVRDTANGEPIVNLEDFCSYGKKVE